MSSARDNDPVAYTLRLAVCITLAIAAHLIAVFTSSNAEPEKDPERTRIIASVKETMKQVKQEMEKLLEEAQQPPPEEEKPPEPEPEPEPPKQEEEKKPEEQAAPEPPPPAEQPPPPPPQPAVEEPKPAEQPPTPLEDELVSVLNNPPPPAPEPPKPDPAIEQPRLEQQRLEQQRLEEQRRLQEQKRLEEQRLAELKRQQELAEQQRLAEQRRREEERLAEQRRAARAAEQRRIEEERRLAEQQRLEEQRRLEEQQRLAEQQRLEEQRRLAEQQRRADEAARAAAAVPPPPPMPPEIGSESVAQRDARIQQSITQLDDYDKFATSAREEVKGKIPAILFTNDDEEEWKALIAYFDLLPIAYAKSDPSYYITIDIARRKMNHTRDFEFIQQRYGRNGMIVRQLGTMPEFVGAARMIMSQFSIRPSDLTIQFLLPRPFAAYLNWKALKTCHEQGLDPATVKACRGRLVREGSKWVWRVDDLLLEDGRTTRVRRGG